VDLLLALILERRGEAGYDRLDCGGGQADLLAALLVGVVGIGRMPLTGDDHDGDLAFALGYRRRRA
jgi:hypothetical protein